MKPVTLDLKGLRCPLPVLRARKAMKPLAAGDRLEVLATDPAAVEDFRSFCETTGHRLLEWKEKDAVFSFLIEKRAG